MRVTLSIALTCTILLLSLTPAYTNPAKDRELEAWNSATDQAEHIGPVNHQNQLDLPWDLLFSSEVGLTVGDNQLLGGEFAGGNFYVTGGNSAGDPNQLYIIDPTGTTFTQLDQWSSAGWGWRDLAYDGAYLYASDDYVIDAFDLDGNAMTAMNITGPITPCRALAYDPVLDHFWTASFSSSLYEFDRTGAIIWSGSTGITGVYGAAWDNAAPDGPWLWIFDQSGTPSTTFYQFDPINYVMTGFSYTVPLLPGSTDQMAGGAFFTDEFDPSYHVLGGVTQGTPEDQVFILEMYDAADPLAPAAPDNFTLTPDPMGALTCDLAWDLPTTTVNGSPISSYPITSVVVQRDGATVATLDPTAISYTDGPSSAGEYTYKVYCVNSYGDGLNVLATAWVGPDVPAGVENLVGTGVGVLLEAELTWDNPTTGLHGGYFTGVEGYVINRYGPSIATITVTGATTTYTDNTIPVQGWYEYGVIPTNASGSGPEVLTGEFYVGPPAFEEIAYDWIEINPAHPGALPGTNSGITLDDQNLGPFNLGFTFPYYGATSFTTIRVCSNGFLSFTSTSTDFSNNPIPDTPEPNNTIAPYWDDMNISSNYYGSIWYYADPGGEFFVVEYDSCNHYGSTYTDEYFTFEAILYPSGDVDFQYKAIVPGNLSPFPSASVGIENADGTVGIQCTYDGSGPLEPVSEMGIRIYSVGTPSGPPDVEVTLVPFQFPIQIPATGGSFEFYAFITNNESGAEEVDGWIEYIDPLGITSDPLMGPATANLEPGTAGWHRIQNIPGDALPGEYTYVGNVGVYPDEIWASDCFIFEKLETGDGIWVDNWDNWGDPFGDEVERIVEVTPDEFVLFGAYPNPFNPTTTIGFSLPDAMKVNLSVYDISGRLVATLIDGWRTAGRHDAVFNAEKLSSGIYFYRIKTDKHQAYGKMIMIK